MKILFVGDMGSPFMKQDCELISEIGKVEVIDLHNVMFRNLIKGIKLLKQIFVGTSRNDIVVMWIADYPAVPAILASKIFRKKIVVNVGGFEVASFPEIGYGAQLKWFRGMISRWVLRNADALITPSQPYADKIKSVEPGCVSVHVIPNFVLGWLCNVPLPEKGDTVVTAYCTRGTERLKGIDVFVQAWPEGTIIRNIPNDKLMIVLANARVYCQLSVTESFGVTVLEAMALGCVPVVSDRDGLPGVVGDTGLVVPYGDVQATRNAITVALQMDGTKVRERAKKFSRERKKTRISELLVAMRYQYMGGFP